MPSERMEPSSPMLGFGGVLVASLIAAIDSVALSVSIPTIADSLHADSISAYWSSTSFILASTAAQPMFPALSAAVGHRTMMVAALAVFVVGTIVCGTAQDISSLIAGRTVQGLGGGGILAMLYVVMADLFDLRTRGKALASNGLVWMIGTAIGPILGGAFSTYVSWRWIFWIVLPIAGISLVMVVAFLRGPTMRSEDSLPDNEKQGTTNPKLKEIDWVGAALLVASLTSFLVPVTWGGVMFDWDSWHTLVPLIVGWVGTLAWVAYEWFVPANPILPLSILLERTTACAFIGTFVLGIVQFGMIIYLPLYYQIVKEYSPLITGVALIPVTLLAGPTTMVAGVLISKMGKYNMIIRAGWVFLALGCGLLILLDADTTVAQWIFITAVSGMGIGTTFTSVSIASQTYVEKAHVATASMLSPFIRALGQAIGIAVGNSVVQNELKRRLRAAVTVSLKENAELIAANVASPTLLVGFMSEGLTVKRELLDAYAGALRAFWWFLFALSCFAGLLSFAMRDMKPQPTSTDGHSVASSSEGEMNGSEKGAKVEGDEAV